MLYQALTFFKELIINGTENNYAVLLTLDKYELNLIDTVALLSLIK